MTDNPIVFMKREMVDLARRFCVTVGAVNYRGEPSMKTAVRTLLLAFKANPERAKELFSEMQLLAAPEEKKYWQVVNAAKGMRRSRSRSRGSD
jgi:hypothetical protein